jgi:hypothetical protein
MDYGTALRTRSVHQLLQRLKGLFGQGIARLNFQSFLETALGAAIHFLAEVRAAQVVMREMARLVALGFHGAFEPGNGFIKPPQFNQIRANIVVGIAKLRIEIDGPAALRDGFVDFALEMISPAQKGMRFRGGMNVERRLIQLHGTFVVAFHLRLIGILKDFPCTGQSFLAHAS